MPRFDSLDSLTFNLSQLLSNILSSMFLICKLTDSKRLNTQTNETDPKKVTEKELIHLNHKIVSLLPYLKYSLF